MAHRGERAGVPQGGQHAGARAVDQRRVRVYLGQHPYQMAAGHGRVDDVVRRDVHELTPCDHGVVGDEQRADVGSHATMLDSPGPDASRRRHCGDRLAGLWTGDANSTK